MMMSFKSSCCLEVTEIMGTLLMAIQTLVQCFLFVTCVRSLYCLPPLALLGSIDATTKSTSLIAMHTCICA